MRDNKNKLAFYHLITAFLFILKGIDKTQHHHAASGITLILFGIVVIALYFFLKRSHFKNEMLNMLIHLFEGFALALTTWIYYSEGKDYLQYLTGLTSVLFFSLFIFHARKFLSEKK